MNKILPIILISLLLGCSKDEFEPVYNVPEEFQPIVESFLAEAQKRGYSIEISNMIITYADDLDSKVCATCYSNGNSENEQKIISINANQCWANYQQKEVLIFHELGHCILNREHDDSSLPNGDPKSMMIKDNIRVYSPCVYLFGNTVVCDFTFKREYYLDELFDESTPIPDWAI